MRGPAAVGVVPPAGFLGRHAPRPPLLTPAARKALKQRMLLQRRASLGRLSGLCGEPVEALRRYHRELVRSDLADRLLARGASPAFLRELPQGWLLYVLVRAIRPLHVVETGVRPGYSTTWILGGLEANGRGELSSLGPGPTVGRAPGVENVAVGQFVPPSMRARWTLVLGNTEDRLRSILAGTRGVDLFLYDNGPDADRARFELKSAWEALAENGILLAHHVEANSAWSDFCRWQGLPAQILDAGPPPLGALSMRRGVA